MLKPKRTFSPSAEHVDAAEAVFACMALVATVRPIVEGYQTRILRELGWGHLPLSQSYTLPEEVFAEYDRRCHLERDLAGLKVDDPGFCPLLVAENLRRKAEHALVDAMEPVTKLSFDKLLCSRNGLENLREYVALTLRLLAPCCKGRLS